MVKKFLLVGPTDEVEANHFIGPLGRLFAGPQSDQQAGDDGAIGSHKFSATASASATLEWLDTDPAKVVEAVIDASGRAEAGTVTVVRSPHPAFDEPARDFVRRALFRPGRMQGRAVRVLVRVPIEFALR